MLKFAAISFVVGASALSVPRSTCSFELTASGGLSGTLGQLPDGQLRIGGGLPASTFSISHGGITDKAGRGCILTPSVNQYQCDASVGPTQGFSIGANGVVTSSGSSKFFACPASYTEWNVYTTPVVGQAKCVEITLKASDCYAAAPPPAPTHTIAPPPPPPAVTVTVTVTECPATSVPIVTYTTTLIPQPSASTYIPPPVETVTTHIPQPSTTTTTTAPPPPTYTKPTITLSTGTAPPGTAPPGVPTYNPSPPLWHNTTRPASPPTYKPTSTPTVVLPPPSCPTTLTGSPSSGNWQFPHLIVPISSSTPSTAAGTSYFGTISPSKSSIFNFDIPASYAGKTCSLVFLLPHHADLETAAYTLSGSGSVDFQRLSAPATEGTTFNNSPSVANDLGTFPLTEGSSTVVSTFACPAGSRVGYEAKSVGGTDLYFFQDYNPSPLGLYITTC